MSTSTLRVIVAKCSLLRSFSTSLCAGNTIWLPSQNEWALIDFGCAAEIGTAAELSFSLYYAPPETIAAWQAGQETVPANPAVDVWALGVRAAPF